MFEEASEAKIDGRISEYHRGCQVELPLADVTNQEQLGVVQELHPSMVTISMFSCRVMG